MSIEQNLVLSIFLSEARCTILWSDVEHNRDKSSDYHPVICYASFYSHHFLHLNCNPPITDVRLDLPLLLSY